QQAITLFGIAQRFFKPFALGDVAGEPAKADSLLDFLDWRNNEVEPAVFASRRTREKLMAKVLRLAAVVKSTGKAVVLRNNSEKSEKGVADDLVLVPPQKLLAGEIDAGQVAGEILSEDNVGGVFDQVAVAGFETRALDQARHLRDQTCRVKWYFEVVVGAGSQPGHHVLRVLLQRADQQDRDGFEFCVAAK